MYISQKTTQRDDNAVIDASGPRVFREVLSHLDGALAVLGLYEQFASRALGKRAWRSSPRLASNGDDTDAVLEHYFRRRFGRAAPVDLDNYAQSVGYNDRRELAQAARIDNAYAEQPVSDQGAHEDTCTMLLTPGV